MLIERLAEAEKRLEATEETLPTGFALRRVRWVIDMDGAGMPQDPAVDLAGAQGAARSGQEFAMPVVSRQSNIRACLLCDTLEYALGVERDPKKTPARHQAFCELAADCAAVTGSLAVRAVDAFLRSHHPVRFDGNVGPQESVAFRVEGAWPTDAPAVRKYWSEHVSRGLVAGRRDEARYTCHICGQACDPIRLWPGPPVGGIAGARRDAALVSFNDDTSRSRGARQAANAPMCLVCASRAQRALRRFIEGDPDRRHHATEGRLTFVFWTRDDTPTDWLIQPFAPKADDVAEMLATVRSGRRMARVESDRFYLTALEGHQNRIAVRQWVETATQDVVGQVACWFEDQILLSSKGQPVRPLAIRSLATALCRDEREMQRLPPAVPESLALSALLGRPLSERLLAAVVHRLRRARHISDAAAVLVKLCLLRHPLKKPEEVVPVALDETYPDAAYRLGRLLEVLDRIQYAQHRRSGLVADKFYASASTVPASVFPQLLSHARVRLARLQRENPGAQVRLEQQIDAILDGLPPSGFPTTLSLPQQGRFALGFYQQHAHDLATAAARSAERKAARATGTA